MATHTVYSGFVCCEMNTNIGIQQTFLAWSHLHILVRNDTEAKGRFAEGVRKGRFRCTIACSMREYEEQDAVIAVSKKTNMHGGM